MITRSELAGLDLSKLTEAEIQELDQLLDIRDPLSVLFDDSFTAVTWEYDYSHVGPEMPGSLHTKQLEALHADAKHRWFFAGNQAGKTTFGAIDLVLLCLGRHPTQQHWQPPILSWASALTWELWEKILLPELLTWIPQDRLVDAPPPHQHSTKRDILLRADNGSISRITGKAAEQGADKYQSARVHAVWLDEEHPESVWDEMQPRLLRFGGITFASMTPLKGLTWVYHRIYEPWKRGHLSASEHAVIHAGLADNPSITDTAIASLKKELAHNPAQLAARLYGHFVKPEGLVLRINPAKHTSRLSTSDIAESASAGRAWGGVDFGLWRFAFLLGVQDEWGRLHVVEEYFSQQESLKTRARALHERCWKYACPASTVIAGDCANPQDILELNLALEEIGSPYRVAAIQNEKKNRRAGVARLEQMLGDAKLLLSPHLGKGTVWKMGMRADSAGKPIEGSRLRWELENWCYPKMPEGKMQKDDPDDGTADGADCCAALRYLGATYIEVPVSRRYARDENQHPGFDYAHRSINTEGGFNQRTPRGEEVYTRPILFQAPARYKTRT